MVEVEASTVQAAPLKNADAVAPLSGRSGRRIDRVFGVWGWSWRCGVEVYTCRTRTAHRHKGRGRETRGVARALWGAVTGAPQAIFGRTRPPPSLLGPHHAPPENQRGGRF